MLIEREFDEGKIIYLTDSVKRAQELQKKGSAVIGICRENDSQDWWDISYLVEDEQSVDEPFLREAYCRFHHMPLPIGRWNHFLVREITLDDCQDIMELYDEEALRFLDAPKSLKEEREKLKAYIEKIYAICGFGLWAVEDTSAHRVIGSVGLQLESWKGQDVCFLGYLIKKEYRQMGIGYHACQIAIQYAREILGVQVLYCRISKENRVSIQLSEKLGFQQLEDDVYKM